MTVIQDAIQDAPELPSPPPPPPAVGNVDPQVLRDQIRNQRRLLRTQRSRSMVTCARGVHRSYWISGACIVGAVGAWLVVNDWRSGNQAFQRDMTLALAEIAAGDDGASGDDGEQLSAAPGVMANPLQPLPLTAAAAYMLGANFKKNDAGVAVGFTDLPPLRSTDVVSQLLASVDLCDVFVRLDEQARVVVAFEPSPGTSPLVDPESEYCAPPLTVPSVVSTTSTSVAG